MPPLSVAGASFVALLSDLAGKPVQEVQVDDEAMTQGMVAAGLPEPVARGVAAFGAAARDGHLSARTDIVRELTGSEPQPRSRRNARRLGGHRRCRRRADRRPHRPGGALRRRTRARRPLRRPTRRRGRHRHLQRRRRLNVRAHRHRGGLLGSGDGGRGTGAKVVKAFNTTLASMLAGDQPLDVFVASDDDDAKGTVAQLVGDVGLRVQDASALRHPRELEALGYLHMVVTQATDAP